MKLDALNKWRKQRNKNFNYFGSSNQKVLLRTLDIKMHHKRMEFIKKILDLIYGYQDVLTTSEQMLFDYYSTCEYELYKSMEEKR